MEKQALVLTWAAERFDEHLRGLDTMFETDNKPLLTLLGQSPKDVLPLRVQRFRMRLMEHKFKAVFVPGKFISPPNVLLRASLRKFL